MYREFKTQRLHDWLKVTPGISNRRWTKTHIPWLPGQHLFCWLPVKQCQAALLVLWSWPTHLVSLSLRFLTWKIGIMKKHRCVTDNTNNLRCTEKISAYSRYSEYVNSLEPARLILLMHLKDIFNKTVVGYKSQECLCGMRVRRKSRLSTKWREAQTELEALQKSPWFSCTFFFFFAQIDVLRFQFINSFNRYYLDISCARHDFGY